MGYYDAPEFEGKTEEIEIEKFLLFENVGTVEQEKWKLEETFELELDARLYMVSYSDYTPMMKIVPVVEIVEIEIEKPLRGMPHEYYD